MDTLSGKNLGCIRGQSLIFENLSFKAEAGKVLALTGPNGCGKTSLLRLIAGLLKPNTGEITWNKNEVSADFLNLNSLWMSQETPLKLGLSVRENIAFLSSISGQNCDTDIINATIEKTGLTRVADYPVQYLSMGQRRRTLLALLYIVKRKIWLIDEPTNHLDALGRDHLVEGVNAFTKQGGMAIIATHRPEMWNAANTLDVSKFSAQKAAA